MDIEPTLSPHESDLTPSLLDTALAYARRGWAVFPLHTPHGQHCSCGNPTCKNVGKHPRTPHGFQDATTDAVTIDRWWTQWPDANIGIATGAVSGLVVVDIDPRHGGQESLEQWRQAHSDDFPVTVASLTGGGGAHLLFAHTGQTVSNPVGLMRGIDIRGDGGYIVAPPSRHLSGRRYGWQPTAHPDTTPLAPLPAWLLAFILTPRQRDDPRMPAPVPLRIPEGQRNTTLFAIGMKLWRQDLSQDALLAALFITNDEQCDPPLSQMEVARIASNICHYPSTASPRQTLPETSWEVEHLTDLGNAKRLVTRHGHDLRYCYPWDKWLLWNGSRWYADQTEEVTRRAKETALSIPEEARLISDTNLCKALLGHAAASEAAPRLRAMIDLARSELGIPVLPDQLDRDPWLLNVLNGTLELRTGTLRASRSEDLITKLAPGPYDPAATCPLWEAFLARIMDGNPGLCAFLQRAIGSALTGDIREQVLYILYGTGANGKSTFLEVLRALLGDYARQTDMATFAPRQTDAIRNDLARLVGARLVTAVEAERGQHLDEALIKQITGGDAIVARFLFQEYFEYYPQFKVFLATNHKPVIRGTDHAIWRRIRLIPFTVTIPEAEQDRTLVTKLCAELPGILAWAVRGCLTWQREGLGVPEEVRQATADYRTEMDSLADFLTACCVLDPQAWTPANELYAAYRIWCDQNGEEPLYPRGLTTLLKERGLRQERSGARTNRRRGWRGVHLLTMNARVRSLQPHGAGEPGETPAQDRPSDPTPPPMTASRPQAPPTELPLTVETHVETPTPSAVVPPPAAASVDVPPPPSPATLPGVEGIDLAQCRAGLEVDVDALLQQLGHDIHTMSFEEVSLLHAKLHTGVYYKQLGVWESKELAEYLYQYRQQYSALEQAQRVRTEPRG